MQGQDHWGQLMKRLLIAIALFLTAGVAFAEIRDNDRVEKTGGDDMQGPFTVNGGSTSLNGLLVFGTTATFNNGFVYLSSSPSSTAFLQIGKQSDNSSTITNSNVSGLLRIMPAKINPQIILGDATSSGTGFFDMSSGRPLALNTLSTGTVQIQTLTMLSNSTMSLTGVLRIIGTGAPPADIQLCLTAGGFLGHCTGLLGCTCVAP